MDFAKSAGFSLTPHCFQRSSTALSDQSDGFIAGSPRTALAPRSAAALSGSSAIAFEKARKAVSSAAMRRKDVMVIALDKRDVASILRRTSGVQKDEGRFRWISGNSAAASVESSTIVANVHDHLGACP